MYGSAGELDCNDEVSLESTTTLRALPNYRQGKAWGGGTSLNVSQPSYRQGKAWGLETVH